MTQSNFIKRWFSFFLCTVVLLCTSCVESSKEKKTTKVSSEIHKIKSEGYITAKDSTAIFYQIKGTGQDTLVVIHGGPGMDSDYMVADFTALSKKHTLIFYDQRGGGRSSLPKNQDKLHIAYHLSDLETLRTYFKLDKLSLVAHSFGPMIAAKYAIAHPSKVAKMVFLGPVPPMQDDFGARYGANLTKRLSETELQAMNIAYTELLEGDAKKGCKAYWDIALKPRLAQGVPITTVKGDCCAATATAIRYGMQVTNGATFGSLGTWDLRPALSKVQTPTLILHGMQEAIPMDMVEDWSRVMPNAKLIKVPKAGHFTYAERPDIVWPAIDNFLKAN